MAVDVRERELLAKSVSLPFVCRDVNRLREEERFVEPVQLLLNCLRATFRVGGFAPDLGLTFLPRAQDEFLHQPHVTRSWLQLFQFVDEEALQFRFGDVDSAALAPAVVIRVPSVSSLRPARRQFPSAFRTANDTFQREVWAAPLAWASHLNSSLHDRLHTTERLLTHERLKVSPSRHSELGKIDEAGVQAIREHPAEALRIQRQAAARAESEARDGVENFFLRESPGRELLEGLRDERATIRIRHKALA